MQASKGAFSAESINSDLPDVGRATVYRTLKLLSEAGILCKTTLPNGAPRYSFDDGQHHHHSICTSCGEVGEFRKPALERLLREMAKEVDGESPRAPRRAVRDLHGLPWAPEHRR